MTLIGLILTLVIVGVIMWAIQVLIPMDPKIKMLLQVVVILVLIIWIAQAFGLLGPLGAVKVR